MHAAGTKNRLDNHSGERAVGRLINEIPAEVELGFPVIRAVRVTENGTVGVW